MSSVPRAKRNFSRSTAGPAYHEFFKPIIQALREKGGSGTTSEISTRAIEILGVTEAEQNVVNKSGEPRVYNQAKWARHYLVKTGYLRNQERGIWELTERGRTVEIESIDPVAIRKQVQSEGRQQRIQQESTNRTNEQIGVDSLDDSTLEELNPQLCGYGAELIMLLQKRVTPGGFERLCQRFLREVGFEQVEVMGRAGDGGIDGIGILKINDLLSFTTLFQCKRYLGSVSASQIRDFRGAMTGRTDKGLFITTGSFTTDAKREARRDGAPPIELVDGDDLVRLFEKNEFGLKPRTTYDIDHQFFEQFMD